VPSSPGITQESSKATAHSQGVTISLATSSYYCPKPPLQLALPHKFSLVVEIVVRVSFSLFVSSRFVLSSTDGFGSANAEGSGCPNIKELDIEDDVDRRSGP
jgi:hypothetical protein